MLTPYVIRGLQTKAARRYHELAISGPKPSTLAALMVGGNVESQESQLIHCWWERERVQPLRKSAGQLLTKLNSLAI